MTNRKHLVQKAGKLETCILIVTILPIIIISFFNHPLGDDYWFSALIRQKGLVPAFFLIYNTVSARYTALLLMSINPLVFGNFLFFKLIPLLYILLLALATFFMLNSLINNGKRDHSTTKEIRLISVVFSITYIAVMPGIGEGLFWTSSLVVYQFSILGFLAWAALVFQWHFQNNRSLRILLGAGLCFVFIIGCNEILGAIVCFINGAMALQQLIKKKAIDQLSTTLLILMVPCWYFIINAPSFTIRYAKPLQPDIKEWVSLFIVAVKYAGYHILKCLINPFLLIGMIITSRSLVNINKWMVIKTDVTVRKLIFYILTWIATIVGIELVAIILTDYHVPPLRISNVAVYFFMFGLLAFATLGINRIDNHYFRLRSGYIRVPVLMVLLAVGFLSNNNISLASRELMNKQAYLYNREMNNRYAVISTCKKDTCSVPSLKHRPRTLRYSSFDDDYHIGEYFKKVILYQD